MPEPVLGHHAAQQGAIKIRHVVTLLDGSEYAAQALPMAQFICETTGAQLTLLSASREYQDGGAEQGRDRESTFARWPKRSMRPESRSTVPCARVRPPKPPTKLVVRTRASTW